MKFKFLILLVVAAISGCANTKHQTVGGAVDAMIGAVSETGTKARGGLITVLGGQVVEPSERPAEDSGSKAASGYEELRKLGVTVVESELHTTFILAGAVFSAGSAAIAPEFTAPVFAVTQEVKRHSGKVEVTGHTDNAGGTSANIELSKQRAISVAKALVGGGVEKSRISVFGAGPAQPIASNSTVEGRAKNRRVEIKLIKQLVSAADIF